MVYAHFPPFHQYRLKGYGCEVALANETTESLCWNCSVLRLAYAIQNWWAQHSCHVISGSSLLDSITNRTTDPKWIAPRRDTNYLGFSAASCSPSWSVCTVGLRWSHDCSHWLLKYAKVWRNYASEAILNQQPTTEHVSFQYLYFYR